MAEKKTCPACGAHTSAVYAAFVGERSSCPHCGLPGDAMVAIATAKAKGADQSLIEMAAKAEQRAASAESRMRELETRLAVIKRSIDGDEYREWGELG